VVTILPKLSLAAAHAGGLDGRYIKGPDGKIVFDPNGKPASSPRATAPAETPAKAEETPLDYHVSPVTMEKETKAKVRNEQRREEEKKEDYRLTGKAPDGAWSQSSPEAPPKERSNRDKSTAPEVE